MRHYDGLLAIISLLVCISATVSVDTARTPPTSEVTSDERALFSLEKVVASIKTGASKFAKRKSVATVHRKIYQDVMKVVEEPKWKIKSRSINAHPNRQVSLLQELTKKYGEGTVAALLVNAKENTRLKDIATTLQTQQLESWRSDRKSIDDVIKLLQISDKPMSQPVPAKPQYFETIDFDPNLHSLDGYIELLNSMNIKHKTDLLTVLQKAFGDERAEVLVSKLAHNSGEPDKYANMVFRSWNENNYDQAKVLTKVFKVPEKNWEDHNWMTAVAERYAQFYKSKNNIA
ncbi:hypothetical protein F442_08886 [Phytophthora nicotianae P10297]|uniref:RxLR effector protein n=1 Tax=Phytophthora nicotianae P10297 TaxID=1317064 RepID=W2ZEA4_PHYNI|nr:hypothetical protein F442_08886 [Phytophthora nicotianae P10297]